MDILFLEKTRKSMFQLVLPFKLSRINSIRISDL